MAALFGFFHLTVEMSEFKAFSIATHRFHDTLFPGLTSHELPPSEFERGIVSQFDFF